MNKHGALERALGMVYVTERHHIVDARLDTMGKRARSKCLTAAQGSAQVMANATMPLESVLVKRATMDSTVV